MPAREVMASLDGKRKPGPAAIKIDEAWSLFPNDGPLSPVWKLLEDAFQTGYGVEHGVPDNAMAWAVAAVWEARCELVVIAQELCLSDESSFELAKDVLDLLDGALTDWGMR